MKQNLYCQISASLFTLVAAAHLIRIIYGWTIQIEGTEIPMMVSVVGLIITGLLAIWGFKMTQKVNE